MQAQEEVVMLAESGECGVLEVQRARLQFFSYDAGVEASSQVVEIHAHALDVVLLDRKSGRIEFPTEFSSVLYPDFHPCGIGDIEPRLDEGEQFPGVVQVDAEVVIAVGTALVYAAGRIDGGKFAPGRNGLDVGKDPGDVPAAGVTHIEEIGFQLDAVDVVVGMRTYGNVSDITPPVVVLYGKVPDVNVPQDVPPAYLHEVRTHRERKLGTASAGVEFESLQVGVADIRVELVQGVVRFRGKIEDALEDEVEVGVRADDLSVERVAGKSTCGRYAGVIITEQAGLVHIKRVHDHAWRTSTEHCMETGIEGELPELVAGNDMSRIEGPGTQGASDFGGAALVYEVPQVQVRFGPADSGRNPAARMETVEGTFGSAFEGEYRSWSVLAEIGRFFPGVRQAGDDARAFRGEGEFVRPEVEVDILRIGDSGHAAVYVCLDAGMQFGEFKLVGFEIVAETLRIHRFYVQQEIALWHDSHGEG